MRSARDGVTHLGLDLRLLVTVLSPAGPGGAVMTPGCPSWHLCPWPVQASVELLHPWPHDWLQGSMPLCRPLAALHAMFS